jgi:2,4-dienoyl-CoA reductase-like NADH-dependent reductase (Old Yellow Enzyme family)
MIIIFRHQAHKSESPASLGLLDLMAQSRVSFQASDPHWRDKVQEALFRPFKQKSLHTDNRFVMAPMTRRRSPNGVPGDDVAQYYKRRAEGGVGFIITEGTTIDRAAASSDAAIPNFHAQDSLGGWKHIVDEVHRAGAKIAPQLWHQGLLRKANTGPHPDAKTEGPSANGGESNAMSDADIADTIEAFARAALAAKEIGFDAVELHGAHGYLIDQFLWSQSNDRGDTFGGDLSKRTRFGAEIVKAVRARVGDDFPVIFRFSQWKLNDYTAKLAHTPKELEAMLAPLTLAGVDIFHASSRRYWEPEFDGSTLNLAGWTKKVTGQATITVGSVGLAGADVTDSFRGETSTSSGEANILDLNARLDREEFDLVAVGRALITDPDWVRKVHDKRFDALQSYDPASLAVL